MGLSRYMLSSVVSYPPSFRGASSEVKTEPAELIFCLCPSIPIEWTSTCSHIIIPLPYYTGVMSWRISRRVSLHSHTHTHIQLDITYHIFVLIITLDAMRCSNLKSFNKTQMSPEWRGKRPDKNESWCWWYCEAQGSLFETVWVSPQGWFGNSLTTRKKRRREKCIQFDSDMVYQSDDEVK